MSDSGRISKICVCACVTRYGLRVCVLLRYPGLQYCVHADLQCRDEEQAAYLPADSPARLRVGADVGRRFHWLVHRQRRADTADQLSYHHLCEPSHRFCSVGVARGCRVQPPELQQLALNFLAIFFSRHPPEQQPSFSPARGPLFGLSLPIRPFQVPLYTAIGPFFHRSPGRGFGGGLRWLWVPQCEKKLGRALNLWVQVHP